MKMKRIYKKVIMTQRCLTSIKPVEWHWHQAGIDVDEKVRTRISQCFYSKNELEEAEENKTIKWGTWD